MNILQNFCRENQVDKVLLDHLALLESKVHLVLGVPKESEDPKEPLGHLGQRDRKEKLERMVDLVEQVHLDLPDHPVIEVLLGYLVLLAQSEDEAHKDRRVSVETQENKEKKGQLGLLDFLGHQGRLDKEESEVNKDL